MKRLTLILLFVALLLATGAVQAQQRHTYSVALGGGESNYLLCAPGGALQYHHPLLSDGSEDRTALIVVCPENRASTSPLALPVNERRSSSMVYLPMIGGTHIVTG